MATALRTLAPDGVSSSQPNSLPNVAGRLLEVWPSEEVLTGLMSYGREQKDPALLRDVERRLLPLLAIPRVRQRLRLLSLRANVNNRADEALLQLAIVRRACRELQESTLLRDVLAVVVLLFNYVNFGTATSATEAAVGSFRGVDVQSLLRLKDTRAFTGEFQGFNMLHFVLQQLLRDRPELKAKRLHEELPSVAKAARVSLERFQCELKELLVDQDFVVSELADFGTEYETEEPRKEEVLDQQEGAGGSGFLSRWMARGWDLAKLAEAWLQGDEVLGLPYHPQLTLQGFDLLMGEDGAAPPPGWLWLARPSGCWQRCWCEVRGPVLVLYRFQDQRCVGAVYAALPGCTVTAVNMAPARLEPERAEDPVQGFEILTVGGKESSRRFRLQPEQSCEVQRWLPTLQLAAEQSAAGFLKAHCADGGNNDFTIGLRVFCVIDGPWLLGFRKARDPLEGTAPQICWQLQGARLLPLGLESEELFGFELERSSLRLPSTEEVAEGHLWRFLCASETEERRWRKLLQPLAESSVAVSQEHPSLTRIDSRGLFHAFCHEDDSRAVVLEDLRKQLGLAPVKAVALQPPRPPPAAKPPQESDDEAPSSEEDESPAILRSGLARLERSLVQLCKRWEFALAKTEADCKRLLAFFGLEEGASLPVAAQKLFEALAQFLVQLRGAWEDLEKSKKAKEAAEAKAKLLSSRHLNRRAQTKVLDHEESERELRKTKSTSDLDPLQPRIEEHQREYLRLMALGTRGPSAAEPLNRSRPA